MKNKKIIFMLLFIIIVIIVGFILLSNKSDYIIKVSAIDDYSPDRILTVYENNNKIEVMKIEYLDGTFLCYGYNTTVHFGDIENEKELKIVLKDNSVKKAKIVEEEVKN